MQSVHACLGAEEKRGTESGQMAWQDRALSSAIGRPRARA